MGRRYPQAAPEQIHQAVWQGQIPQDIVQTVQDEERQIYRDALANGRDPADDIERYMVSRGYQNARTRAAQADRQRRQREAEAAQERKAEAEEAAWRRNIALKMHYGHTLEELLPNRADRVRWYQGSTYYRDHGAR